MDKNFKILLVEDVKTDAELIEMELERDGMIFSLFRVETKNEFLMALETFLPDIILSDYSLPRFSALEALKIKEEKSPFTPFILVTGAQSEEIAVDCIKRGADDYILKSSLTRLSTAISNILKKKKAEKENALSFEKYKNLFECSLVGMFRASLKDGVILEANDKAKHILGIRDLIGVHLSDLNLFKEENDLSKIFANGRNSIENLEIEFTKQDLTKSWLSVSAKLYEKDGIVEGVIHDVTRTKNSFLELENANYELDRFVYHASHDMRSPLRSIEGLLQAMLEEDSIEEMRVCAKMMQRSTQKLDKLIEDLLILARNKKSEARITSIDFQHELEDSIVQLNFLDNFKNIRFSTEVEQTDPFFSDAVRLRIILNNLISNAVKYHRINQTDPFIEVKISSVKEKAVLTISDNGSGIDERHVNKIFDMFYRATNSSEGSGLGLYLVKHTIDKLQGTITIKSVLNEGTTFVVEIPNSAVKASAPSEQEAKMVNL